MGLALFEVLAGGAFGHLNYSLYQHNGELDTNSSTKSNAQGFSWREGAQVVLELKNEIYCIFE